MPKNRKNKIKRSIPVNSTSQNTFIDTLSSSNSKRFTTGSKAITRTANKSKTDNPISENRKLKFNTHKIRKKHWLAKNIPKPTVQFSKKRIFKQWFSLVHKRNMNRRILRYIRQQYFSRHRYISLYQQQKRSPFEYRKTKILGRKRDRLKAKRVGKAKRRSVSYFKRKSKSYKCSSKPTYISQTKSITTFTRRPKHEIESKIQFYENHEKTLKISRKEENGMECFLNSCFDCSDATVTSCRSLQSAGKKILLRYYNQTLFIYSTPLKSSKRPSKKYLFDCISTTSGSIEPKTSDSWQSPPLLLTIKHRGKQFKEKSQRKQQKMQISPMELKSRTDDISQWTTIQIAGQLYKKKKHKGRRNLKKTA